MTNIFVSIILMSSQNSFKRLFEKIAKSQDYLTHWKALTSPPAQESSQGSRIFWNLFPLSTRYSALTFPVNLFEYSENYEALKDIPYLFVRDGAYLAWQFFRKHPRPHNKNQTLLVHPTVFRILPKAWRRQALIWEQTASSTIRKSSLQEEISNITLFAINTPEFLGLRDSDSFLKKISQLAKQYSLKNIDLIIDEPLVVLPNERSSLAIYRFKYLETLKQRLQPLSLRPKTASKFLAEPSLTGTLFCDLHEDNLIYADNYLTFHAFNKGASVLKNEQDASQNFYSKSPLFILDISPGHECRIHSAPKTLLAEPPPKSLEYDMSFWELRELMSSPHSLHRSASKRKN
ncbi:MAG: hypothetical protein KUL82_00060 [Bdellovibrio sp.]|nr:hypothetical protein [Bdellovibrio sp.]